MEWLTKLISILKIPLIILLPSSWLFSGIMIFANDKFLKKLNVLSWSEENGFVFGLLFLITSCLIFAYIIRYAFKSIKSIIWKLSFKRKTMLCIFKLNPMESAIIIKLYNSIGHTHELDSTQPYVKALEYKEFIFSGGTQIVTLGQNNSMFMKYMLQPFVSETLDYYKDKISKKIIRLEEKITKENNPQKLDKLNSDLQQFKEIYKEMFNGGLDND